MNKSIITYDDFLKADIRVGTVIAADAFPQVRKPAYVLQIDFGPEIGVKKTSAQITVHYTPESLIGKQVCAVINFPPKQIGPIQSEVLVLGFTDSNGAVVLVNPDQAVPDGQRLH
ncbi:MAG: tRNA-binding protein [Pseudomonadota bacterium]|nr:tRNA-binding protein [Pseudomonadota bacterium]